MILADVNGLIITYAYDADGMRVQKNVGNEESHYLLDKNREFAQVIQEYDNVSFLAASYVHGLDLISQKKNGFTNYFHYDGQHSTRALTDGITQITDTYNYDAFGLLLQRSGSTLNDFLYSGEQFDQNVGFYYLRARYYNPEMGRFITVDPWQGSIYDPVSLHKYLYCNNDPVNFVDWSGEMSLLMNITLAITISMLAGLWVSYRADMRHKGFSDLTPAGVSLKLEKKGITILAGGVVTGGIAGLAIAIKLAAVAIVITAILDLLHMGLTAGKSGQEMLEESIKDPALRKIYNFPDWWYETPQGPVLDPHRQFPVPVDHGLS